MSIAASMSVVEQQTAIEAQSVGGSACSVRRLATAAALAMAGIFATRDAWADLARAAWRDEESSQILMAPIIIAWLVWVGRDRLAACRPTGTLVGPVLVALGWFGYSWGLLHLSQVLWHAGAVLVAVGCVLSVLGWPVFRAVLPGVIAVAFLVPVPGRVREAVALPLQRGAAMGTQFVLDLLGTPVERSGNLLSVNGVEVAVAEACNGLRMVSGLFVVCYTAAFVQPLPKSGRLAILLLSPVLAVAANLVRLTLTVWVYGRYPESIAQQVHDVAGWAMLPATFFLLLAGVRVARWARPRREDESRAAES